MELMGTSPKIDLYSHPLFLRMVNEHGFESCDKDTFPQFLQKPGLSMVVFIEDPNRMKETMDALVIAPELAKSCGLIEHKAGVRLRPAHLAGQLQPLCLAAGQARRFLAQRQVAKAQIPQHF